MKILNVRTTVNFSLHAWGTDYHIDEL